MYVPPGLTRLDHENIFESISSSTEAILSGSDSGRFIVAGDLNDFSTEDLELQFSLKQVVSQPTRREAILDKILMGASLIDFYNSPIVGPNLSNSDHRTVFLKSLHSAQELSKIKKVYDFRESNLANFVTKLNSYNWSKFYRSKMDIDEKAYIFHQRVNDALATIPFDFVRMSKNDKPWLTPKLKLLINKRFQSYRSKDWKTFQHLKMKIKKEIASAKRTWTDKCSSSSHGLWKSVSEIRNKRYDNRLATLLSSFPSLATAVESINSALCENFNQLPNWECISESIKNIPEDEKWDPHVTVYFVYRELSSHLKEAAVSDGLNRVH